VSSKHAAECLGVSQNTIRKFVAEEKLPAYLIGEKLVKFDPADLDHFLASNRIDNSYRTTRPNRTPSRRARARVYVGARLRPESALPPCAVGRASSILDDFPIGLSDVGPDK
jgi:excisionase family DNA binding protein